MREFFEGDGNRLSMARLCMFISCIISSIAFIWMAGTEKLGGEIFAIYCGTWGGTYVWGKHIDKKGHNDVDKTQSVVPEN